MKKRGFTLLELLTVIAIIGILAAIIVGYLGVSREKGRDAARKSQSQELIKALELYYSDNESYPTHHGTYEMSEIINLITATQYLSRAPDNIGDFRYCSSDSSFIIAVNTEQDMGGTNYCHIVRGPGPYGCTPLDLEAADPCTLRF